MVAPATVSLVTLLFTEEKERATVLSIVVSRARAVVELQRTLNKAEASSHIGNGA